MDWRRFGIFGALAAAAAAGWWAMKQANQPLQVLSVRNARYFASNGDTDWRRGLGAFDAVATKIADGASVWTSQPPELIDATRAAGAAVWGWGYHYLSPWRGSGNSWQRVYSSAADSIDAEADAIAAAVQRYSPRVYLLNAEKEAFGRWGAPAAGVKNQTPDNIARFLELTRARVPRSCRLYWNGLTADKYQDSDGDYGRRGMTPEIVAMLEGAVPMIYAKGPDTSSTRANMAKRWAKSRAKFAGVPVWGPMTGAKTDYLWTYPDGGEPGLAGLVERFKPELVSYFYGPGSRPITQGTPAAPALTELGAILKSGGAFA